MAANVPDTVLALKANTCSPTIFIDIGFPLDEAPRRLTQTVDYMGRAAYRRGCESVGAECRFPIVRYYAHFRESSITLTDNPLKPESSLLLNPNTWPNGVNFPILL